MRYSSTGDETLVGVLAGTTSVRFGVRRGFQKFWVDLLSWNSRNSIPLGQVELDIALSFTLLFNPTLKETNDNVLTSRFFATNRTTSTSSVPKRCETRARTCSEVTSREMRERYSQNFGMGAVATMFPIDGETDSEVPGITGCDGNLFGLLKRRRRRVEMIAEAGHLEDLGVIELELMSFEKFNLISFFNSINISCFRLATILLCAVSTTGFIGGTNGFSHTDVIHKVRTRFAHPKNLLVVHHLVERR